MRVYGAGVWKGLITPDRVQNDIARKRPVRVLEEKRQQIIFGGSEFQLHAAPGDDAAFEIDGVIRERDDLMGFGQGTPHHRADTREQFAGAEGLHHIIVGADLKQENFVDLLAYGARAR